MSFPVPANDGDALLSLVLKAQQRSAEQLSAARLPEAAARLVELAESLDLPLLLPVSREAERLVGAALLIGAGRVDAADAATYLAGRKVLLVDAVVVQTSAVVNAAYFAERAGAEVVGTVVLDQVGGAVSAGGTVHSLMQS